jgi:hypothetical protein
VAINEAKHPVGEEWVDPVFGPVRRIPKPTPWERPAGNSLTKEEEQIVVRRRLGEALRTAAPDDVHKRGEVNRSKEVGPGDVLFEVKQRTRTAPKKPGEGDFAFYDSAARPEYDFYRDLVNGWIEELPEADRAQIIARMQKGDSLQYQAALAELTIHAALKRRGYNVLLHPTCGHATRKPDFEVQSAETKPIAIVEVTTFNPAQDEIAQAQRDAAVYNALDKAGLPAGWRIGLDIVKHGEKAAALGQICKAVETWTAEVVGEDPFAMPTKTFDADDWSIEITLFGGYKKGVPSERMIATAMGDVRLIKPHQEIRQAVQFKGSRYGAMTLPYLIAVADCKGELRGGRIGDAALEAMCGTIVTDVRRDKNGKTDMTKDRRLADGYWGTPDAPKHRDVSGILILPKPHLWDLRNERWQPIVLRNPWAQRPLPDDLLPLPGFEYDRDTDSFVAKDGTQLADMLGLPTVWPPEGT